MHNGKNDRDSNKAGRDPQFSGDKAVNLQAKNSPALNRRKDVPTPESTPVEMGKRHQPGGGATGPSEQPFAERRRSPRWLASRLLRMKEVAAICGLSSSSIYKNVRSGTFPQPIKIGLRASAWIKPEVEAWIEQRISASRR